MEESRSTTTSAESCTSRAIRAPRMRLIAATLTAKRAQYPELRQAPTLAGLEALADAEDIVVLPRRLPDCVLGRALYFGGAGVVMIADDVDDETRLLVTAHELAHIWLGHCDTASTLSNWLRAEMGPWYATHTFDGPVRSRIEDEANILTAELLQTSHAELLRRIEGEFRQRERAATRRSARLAA